MAGPARTDRGAWYAGGVVVLSLLSALAVVSCEADTFDAAAWRAQQGNLARDNPRSGQVTALERGIELRGKTRDDVRQLLGEPDRSDAGSDDYLLGASPVGVDLEVYRIEYRQGRVVDRGVRRQ